MGLCAQLLGNSLLGVYFPPPLCWFHSDTSLTLPLLLPHPGKVEMLKGIHAVFKGMPLYWGRGYLSRALAIMERAVSDDVKLPKDTVKTEKYKVAFIFCTDGCCHRTQKIIRISFRLGIFSITVLSSTNLQYICWQFINIVMSFFSFYDKIS